MNDLRFGLEERPSRIDLLMRWLPRVAIAVAFASLGSAKLAAGSTWVDIFRRIGLGQWFRYATGTLQIAGAALVLIPRTFIVGIAMLACTMVGAIVTWLFVLHAPGFAIIPFVILVALVAVGMQHFR